MLGFPLVPEIIWVNCLPAEALCLVWKHNSHIIHSKTNVFPNICTRIWWFCSSLQMSLCACVSLVLPPPSKPHKRITHLFLCQLLFVWGHIFFYKSCSDMFSEHISLIWDSALTDLIMLKYPAAKWTLAPKGVFLLLCFTPAFRSCCICAGSHSWPLHQSTSHTHTHTLPHTYDTLSVASWVRAGTGTSLLSSATTNMVTSVQDYDQ